MTTLVKYHISPAAYEAHLFQVDLTFFAKSDQPIKLSLPAWIPGSYMIREFSRQIGAISATCHGKQLSIEKLSKNEWNLAACEGEIQVSYPVYAYDLSVRGAYLDETRGFFNATSLCLMVDDLKDLPHQLVLQKPNDKVFKDWDIATSLTCIAGSSKKSFGTYQANDYDELIDSPVEMGELTRLSFKACGVPHEFVISGEFTALDEKRLIKDVKKICETQIRMFDTHAPFKQYTFMLYVGQDIYGGLEHRASTALVANRDDLPALGEKTMSDGYIQLLGLISHEYFHSWNVKRIKPAVFVPYNLNQENYTTLLWAFEGVTSYYDDLVLLRAGLITPVQYLNLVAKVISGVYRGAGHAKQNLMDSSFDAWTKYYRQDENSVNSIVSYYTKGSLVALALDLLIRDKTQGEKSLDDVMCALWQRWKESQAGVAETEWESVAAAVTGLDLTEFFDLALRSTQMLPLVELLATQGVTLTWDYAKSGSDMGSASIDAIEPSKPKVTLGVKTQADAGGVKLQRVLDDSAAQAAGLSAGDVVIACNGLKVSDLDKAIARYKKGDKLKIHAFRRDELRTFQVVLKNTNPDTCRLVWDQVGSAWLSAITEKREK